MKGEVGKETEKKADEIDWERYLENYSLQAARSVVFGGGGDSDELPGYRSRRYSRQSRTSWTEHVMWQLRMSGFCRG